MKTVIILTRDLILQSQLQPLISRQGLACRVVTTVDDLVCGLTEADTQWVVIDLSHPAATDCPPLVDQIRSQETNSPPQLIAFGPHVQAERLKRAREAGIDRVVTRGSIAAEVAALSE